MATAGPNGGGTFADDAAVGTNAWGTPSRAAYGDGFVTNWYELGGAGTYQSHYLKCTNFGFAIPSGNTINGVRVDISRSGKASPNTSQDAVVSLVKGGTVSGDNKAATGTAYPTTLAEVSYGGAADLWGLSLTYTDVNSSTFGMVLSNTGIYSTSNPNTNVQHVRITITYTASASGLSIPVAMQSYRQRRA